MTDYKTPPVVAGGIYRRIYKRGSDGQDLVEHAEMGPVKQLGNGRVRGVLRRFSLPDTLVEEGKEELSQWDLVAIPEKLEDPIRGEARMDEKERLEQENEYLKRRLAQIEGVD